MYSVSQEKEATIQIQISALTQTSYCNAFKFIIAFKLRVRKNTQFYTHEDEEKLLRACLYERRDGTFTGTRRLSSRIHMNILQAGQ